MHSPKMPVALSLLLGLALVAAGVLLVKFWGWLQGSDSPAATIRNLGVVLASIIALPLAIWRSVVAHRQSETQRRGLLNERYQRGADMLGGSALSVRLGGIYALDWLAEEHTNDYHIQVMSLFSAFARHPPDSAHRDSNEDIHAILAFLCKRDDHRIAIEEGGRYRLDLRGAKLNGACLEGIKMPGGDMSGAEFKKARFANSKLTKVKFLNSDLTGAWFSGADLTEACFKDADLANADFSEAVLANTDLRGAKGLTQAQLDSAKRAKTSPNVAELKDAETKKLLTWTRQEEDG